MPIHTSFIWLAITCIGFLGHHIFGTYYHELSSLEKSVVDEGLKRYNLIPVDDATNLTIGTIYIVTASPFSDEAGWLTLLNRLHINTRDEVIRRYLVMNEGAVFDETAIRDSEIVLRSLLLVRSLAVIVPVKQLLSKNKHEIDLLVATKDVVSLRPSFSLSGSIDAVTDAFVSIGEHNLLGYNKSISAIYEYHQWGQIVSARYFDPQLFNSRFRLTVKPSVILSTSRFGYDGFLGEYKLERPLLAQRDFIGYGASTSFGSKPVIDFKGTKVRTVKITHDGKSSEIEKRYRYNFGQGSLFGRLSFGHVYKNEIFGSYNVNVKRPLISRDLTLTEPQEEYFKKHVLPRNEIESYIALGYSYFTNNYLVLYDYDNFKLQEIERTGPVFAISNDFAAKKVLFSDHNFLRPQVKASILQPFNRDSFMQLGGSATTRFDGDFTDNFYKTSVNLVSPKLFGLGRAIFAGTLALSSNDRDNIGIALGSESGLRGVESRYYYGDLAFRANVELRSLPLDIWILHAGMVVFYDVGAAFNKWSKANPTHALGFGIRVLAPQLSSILFRLDLAFPIYGRGANEHVVVPSFGTGQAF